MGDAPNAVLAFADAGKAFIGLERIPAGRDEIDDGIEIRAGQRRVGAAALTSA